MTPSLRTVLRRFLFFLLLLPLPLVSQVKILMPVVVKDAAGRPVTDLKLSDFQVSGPKNIKLADISLVPPATASKDDSRVSIVVIYDAPNVGTSNFAPFLLDIREFLHEVADRRLAVTLLVNTQDGLRLVHNARTPPEVLSAALAATSRSAGKATEVAVPISDPKVDEEAKNLRILDTAAPVFRSRLNAEVDQMNSLLALAHLVQQSPGRKALVWMTLSSPASATQLPAYWNSTTIHADKSLLPMYEATVEELNAAHVSVYPLMYVRGNPETVGVAWDHWMGLKQLAESTGGLALRLGQQKSLLGAVQEAVEDSAPYYMLAVEVPAPKELDWIPVKIKVNRPGVTVRAAPGYLALKPVKTQ